MNAAAAFLERAARHPERVAYRTLAAGGAPADAELSWGEWARQSRAFAAALVSAGVQPGDCVAILAGSSTVWPVADLGVLLAGAVSVGLYPTSAPAQVRQILADCGARVAVADSEAQLGKVPSAQCPVPSAPEPGFPILERVIGPVDGEGVTGWDAWLAAGARHLEDPAVSAELERRLESVGGEDIALLIYTSGSTGEPKGAEISHRCLLASAESIASALGFEESDSTLSFLPFCHAAERIFGLHTRIHAGMEAGLVADPTRVWEAASAYRPTVFGGLPRFFEKSYEALSARHREASGEERAAWDRTIQLGTQLSRLRQAGIDLPAGVQAEWREVGAPFFALAGERFGGRARRVTSGGAALPREVAEYLDALGIAVLGAYGLTEHLCVAMNRPGAYRFDTAGPPMPGSELAIAADGEVLVRRGPLSFSGYRGRPAESAAAFTADGWLLTGDLGELGADGTLRITGRKKELIALSTGKKVAPLPIESALADEPWISQAMLYGEGRKFISALIALRPAMLEEWHAGDGSSGNGASANGHGEGGHPAGTPTDRPFLTHPGVLAQVQAAVDRVNAGFSRSEQVRRFLVLDRELSAEEGELTPTLKLRRDSVAARFGADLDALYLMQEP